MIVIGIPAPLRSRISNPLAIICDKLTLPKRITGLTSFNEDPGMLTFKPILWISTLFKLILGFFLPLSLQRTKKDNSSSLWHWRSSSSVVGNENSSELSDSHLCRLENTLATVWSENNYIHHSHVSLKKLFILTTIFWEQWFKQGCFIKAHSLQKVLWNSDFWFQIMILNINLYYFDNYRA